MAKRLPGLPVGTGGGGRLERPGDGDEDPFIPAGGADDWGLMDRRGGVLGKLLVVRKEFSAVGVRL